METKTIENLTELGYGQAQINQIIMAYEDENKYIDKIATYVPINTFRNFKKYYKKNCNNNIDEKLWNKLVEKINKDNLDIEGIADTKHNDAAFALKIYMYNKEIYEDIYKRGKEPTEKIKFVVQSLIEDDIDLTEYKYEIEELKIIKTALMKESIDVDIKNKKFSEEQLKFLLLDTKRADLCEEMLNPNYTVAQMELAGLFKSNDFDTSYIEKYNESEVEAYISLIISDIDITPYYKNSYNKTQIDVIERCLESHLEPEFLLNYINKVDDRMLDAMYDLYSSRVTKESIEKFIEASDRLKKEGSYFNVCALASNYLNTSYSFSDEEYDITPLLTPGLNPDQRQVIMDAIRRHVDPEKFLIKEMPYQKMRFLLEKLTNGDVIDNACDPKYSINDMSAIVYYNTKGIFYDTIEEYRKNYVKDKNSDFETFCKIYKEYSNRSFTDEFALMSILVNSNKKREYQVDIEQILSLGYYAIDINELFTDIENNIDVNLIWKRNISSSQREELRNWFKAGLDVQDVLHLSSKKLKELRLSKEKESLDEKISRYEDKNKNEHKKNIPTKDIEK